MFTGGLQESFDAKQSSSYFYIPKYKDYLFFYFFLFFHFVFIFVLVFCVYCDLQLAQKLPTRFFLKIENEERTQPEFL